MDAVLLSETSFSYIPDFRVVAEAIDIAHGVNIDHVALMPR
jgi:hypothetical protein